MYKVIYKFADKLDKNYIYEVGDIYPREGIDVADERLAELSSKKNAIGKPVIEKIMEKPIKEEKPKAKRK